MGLSKVQGIEGLKIELKPPVARFNIDAERYSIQDLIRAVEASGEEFDARLMVQAKADEDKLSAALRSVDGVRSPGSPDEKGVRLVTFYMDHRTLLGDLQRAASAVGAKLQPPTLQD